MRFQFVIREQRLNLNYWISKARDWQQGTSHLDYKGQEVFQILLR